MSFLANGFLCKLRLLQSQSRVLKQPRLKAVVVVAVLFGLLQPHLKEVVGLVYLKVLAGSVGLVVLQPRRKEGAVSVVVLVRLKALAGSVVSVVVLVVFLLLQPRGRSRYPVLDCLGLRFPECSRFRQLNHLGSPWAFQMLRLPQRLQH